MKIFWDMKKGESLPDYSRRVLNEIKTKAQEIGVSYGNVTEVATYMHKELCERSHDDQCSWYFVVEADPKWEKLEGSFDVRVPWLKMSVALLSIVEKPAIAKKVIEVFAMD